MGFFKKLLGDTADKLKEKLEDTADQLKEKLEDTADQLKEKLEDTADQLKEKYEDAADQLKGSFEVRKYKKQKNLNISKQSFPREKDEENDDEPRIILGKMNNGILEIRDDIEELDDESLEDYKNLRKIILPSSLKKLESYVICDQENLEELDFSKVDKLKTIPDDFISGENKISKFVIPNGVTEVGSGFLGDAKSGAEIFVPASVSKLGFISENSNNDMSVYLFAADIDITDVEPDLKTLYVLPDYYGQYAKKLKDCDSEARLREMPEDMFDIYAAPTEGKYEERQTNQPETEEKSNTSNSGLFSERLEAMIAAALQDGVLTDKEREILKRRVEKEGEDWDEVEMIIEARLAEMQPSISKSNTETLVEQKVISEIKEKEELSDDEGELSDDEGELSDDEDELSDDEEEFSDDEETTDDDKYIDNIHNKKIVVIPEGIKIIEENYFFNNWLTKLILPASLEEIEDSAFYDCEDLKEIDFSRCTKLESIGVNAFRFCKKLSNLSFPASLQSIESWAFDGCKRLSSITLPVSIRRISGFSECDNLQVVDLSKCTSIEYFEEDAFHGCQSTEFVLPTEFKSLKGIGAYAFADCEKITSFPFSESLTKISWTSFIGCSNLQILDFSKCKELENINYGIIYKKDLDSLKKIVLPPSQSEYNALCVWTSGVHIGNETNLVEVDMSQCVFDAVPREAFQTMDLKEIVIPDTVETIGDNAFDECKELKTIVLPAALKEIQAPLGSCLESLKKVDFSKVTQLKVIPKTLFDYGCEKLKELIIPQGVVEIEDNAFKQLSSLKKLFLPPSLTEIGDLELCRLSVFCYSPHLDELEPIVYGWDDINDDDEEEDDDDNENKQGIQIKLFVLPQYVDAYTAQRDAEGIPENVLPIQPIPDEYLYYYDN